MGEVADEQSDERASLVATYQKWSGQVPWLVLTDKGLGCKVCLEYKTSRKKRGLAAGEYVPKKYLYQRTWQQHVQDNGLHAEAVAATTSCSADSKPAEQGSPRKIRRSGSSGSVESPGTGSLQSPGRDSLGSPGKDSLGSPGAESAGRKRPRARASPSEMFFNSMVAAYSVMVSGWSSTVYSAMMLFGRLISAAVPDGHSSSTILSEMQDIIYKEARRDLETEIQQSPGYSLTVDEKDGALAIVVTYLRDGHVVSRACGYRTLHGLESEDLAATVKFFVGAWGLDPAKLCCVAADGASVNGSTRRQTDITGKNLAAALRRWHQHPMLCTHCAAHRLQLVVCDGWNHTYLTEMEKCISSLFKHLRNHPATAIDLHFWAEVTAEPALSGLSMSSARWLSLLKPLKRLFQSHTCTLAHLHYHFMHERDREAKKTLRWLFLTMATWRFKLTMAGLIDILEHCWETKLRLESDRLSLDEVSHCIAVLKCKLESYVMKESVAAHAIAGGEASCTGTSCLEKTCAEYRDKQGQQLKIILYLKFRG